MKKILLLSDTHSFIDDSIKKYAKKVDEIWHAGDIGNIEVYDNLKKITMENLEGVIAGKSIYSGNIRVFKALEIINTNA